MLPDKAGASMRKGNKPGTDGTVPILCPQCAGKPWTEEFLEAKDEIEGPDKLLAPF